MPDRLESLTEEAEKANRHAAKTGTVDALGNAAYLNQQWTEAFYGQHSKRTPEQQIFAKPALPKRAI